MAKYKYKQIKGARSRALVRRKDVIRQTDFNQFGDRVESDIVGQKVMFANDIYRKVSKSKTPPLKTSNKKVNEARQDVKDSIKQYPVPEKPTFKPNLDKIEYPKPRFPWIPLGLIGAFIVGYGFIGQYLLIKNYENTYLITKQIAPKIETTLPVVKHDVIWLEPINPVTKPLIQKPIKKQIAPVHYNF